MNVLTHADIQTKQRHRRRNSSTDSSSGLAVSIMLSIICAALNATSVHIMIVAFPAERKITHDTSTTVTKKMTTMTRNKQELADNTPKTFRVCNEED